MLDDNNVLMQRDPSGALDVAAKQFEQAQFRPDVLSPEHDGRTIENIVITGMGGSTLAASLLKSLKRYDMPLPLEVVRGYGLPGYVGPNTLVIASSYSGTPRRRSRGLLRQPVGVLRWEL